MRSTIPRFFCFIFHREFFCVPPGASESGNVFASLVRNKEQYFRRKPKPALEFLLTKDENNGIIINGSTDGPFGHLSFRTSVVLLLLPFFILRSSGFYALIPRPIERYSKSRQMSKRPLTGERRKTPQRGVSQAMAHK